MRVEQAKNTKELKRSKAHKEHPALTEKKARVEIAELDIREFESMKKLQAIKEEEIRKAKGEEETRL